MNKNGLQTNTEKTDDKTFCGVAQTKQSFRKSILNLTVSEFHTQVFIINFTS